MSQGCGGSDRSDAATSRRGIWHALKMDWHSCFWDHYCKRFRHLVHEQNATTFCQSEAVRSCNVDHWISVQQPQWPTLLEACWLENECFVVSCLYLYLIGHCITTCTSSSCTVRIVLLEVNITSKYSVFIST
jgi:hypothetical protein